MSKIILKPSGKPFYSKAEAHAFRIAEKLFAYKIMPLTLILDNKYVSGYGLRQLVQNTDKEN